MPFGINGRSVSGSVVPLPTQGLLSDRKLRLQVGSDPTEMRTATVSVSSPEQQVFDVESMLLNKRRN